MKNKINVIGSSEPDSIPVRRRNTQGALTSPISITLPKELHQTINGIVVKTSKSRSLVIAELIEKGLQHTVINYKGKMTVPATDGKATI
jgi:hypothetical protein